MQSIELKGPWDKGYAISKLFESKTIKGADVFGKTIVEKKYTPLGELYRLWSYRHQDHYLEIIMEHIKPFLDNWNELKEVDITLSAPTSKQRSYQPLEELSRQISSYLNIPYNRHILYKNNNEEIKGKSTEEKKRILKEAISINHYGLRPYNALIIDDMFCSGETLINCVNALKLDPMVRKIYILALVLGE